MAAARVELLTRFPDVMFNTRRQRDERLDSSPFSCDFRLASELRPAFTALLHRGQQQARAQLSSLVSCECVYFNGEIPRVYSAEDGWSSLPTMALRVVDFSADTGVITLGIERRFPLSSCHAEAPFRLVFVFEGAEPVVTKQFVVQAKQGKAGSVAKERRLPKREVPDARRRARVSAMRAWIARATPEEWAAAGAVPGACDAADGGWERRDGSGGGGVARRGAARTVSRRSTAAARGEDEDEDESSASASEDSDAAHSALEGGGDALPDAVGDADMAGAPWGVCPTMLMPPVMERLDSQSSGLLDWISLPLPLGDAGCPASPAGAPARKRARPAEAGDAALAWRRGGDAFLAPRDVAAVFR